MSPAPQSELDLRSFLAAAATQGPSHYRSIAKTVSPKWEMTAIATKLAERLRFPVLRFESVAGSQMPVVTNTCSSIERVAKTIGVTKEQLEERLAGAAHAPVPPVEIESGAAPAREKVHSGAAVDLFALPQVFYTEDQTAPYLTAAIVAARDPDSGAHNLSFHRLMIEDRRTTAIFMTPDGHLEQIWRKNAARGKPTPIGVVIGSHPLWCYASLATSSLESDDYGVLGAVLGAPLAVVPSLADPGLLLPARAEILLEGSISHDAALDEGPFGEFLGFVAKRARRPAVAISSVSTRNAPVFQDIVAGQIEHLTLSSVTLRARLERDLRAPNPAVTGIFLPAALTLFLSLDMRKQPELDPMKLMTGLLASNKYLKQVICFDHEVDVRKQSSVQHALACHVQADRDVTILAGQKGNGIDPSERDAKTAKIAINALPKKASVPNRLPKGLLESIDLNAWLP